jgi:VanZ family protein
MVQECVSADLTTVRQDIVACLSAHSAQKLASFRAEFHKEHLDPLLDTARFPLKKGRGSNRVWALQDEILGYIKTSYPINSSQESLKNDDTFHTFSKKICVLASRYCDLTVEQLQTRPENAKEFVDHIIAHYELLQEHGMPRSIIERSQFFSIFEVGKILKEAQQFFGENKSTESLVKTASDLVFMRRYETMQEAKESYDEALKQAEEIFGTDPRTQQLVKTSALLVFLKVYKSVEDAKQTYDNAFQKAKDYFGDSPDTDPLAKTAANRVFRKTVKSIEEALEKHNSMRTR